MAASRSDVAFVSLATQAYDALEEKIATLQLAPGAVLSEQQLANELGIGRSPVREALQRLAQEGLVVILPRRGVLVSEINVSRQSQLLELRRVVERLLVRGACGAANERQNQEFENLAQRFQQIADQDDVISLMRLDARLNDLMAESSDNEFVVRAMGLMRGLSRRFWFKYFKLADLRECAELHGNLARAIADRNPDRASRTLDGLIDYLEDFTRSTLRAR